MQKSNGTSPRNLPSAGAVRIPEGNRQALQTLSADSTRSSTSANQIAPAETQPRQSAVRWHITQVPGSGAKQASNLMHDLKSREHPVSPVPAGAEGEDRRQHSTPTDSMSKAGEEIFTQATSSQQPGREPAERSRVDTEHKYEAVPVGRNLFPLGTPVPQHEDDHIAPPTGLNSGESKSQSLGNTAQTPASALKSSFQPFDEAAQATRSPEMLLRADLAGPLNQAAPAPARNAMEIEGEALRIWGSALDDRSLWGGPLPDLALRKVDAFRPTTVEEAQTFVDLVRSANRNPMRLRQLDELFQRYRHHIPEFVFKTSALRTVSTLQTLFEANITADQLDLACRMALARDSGAHLMTAMASYLAGFFTLNTVNLKMMDEGVNPNTREFFAPLALGVANVLMQCILRTGEMGAGWTRFVEAGNDGKAMPASQTLMGALKTFLQYWPFAISMAYINASTGDPAAAGTPAEKALQLTIERTELRRLWGFVATAGVALHRTMLFNKDHAWLDATRPEQKLAMLGAIEQLTSPQKTLRAAMSYVLRPIAGAVSLLGCDPIQYLHERDGPSQVDEGRSTKLPTRPAEAPVFTLDPRFTLARIALLAFPLMVANGLRDYAVKPHLPASDFRSGVNDWILLTLWGASISAIEWTAGANSRLNAENKWRGDRQLAINARQVAPATRQQLGGVRPHAAEPNEMDPLCSMDDSKDSKRDARIVSAQQSGGARPPAAGPHVMSQWGNTERARESKDSTPRPPPQSRGDDNV